MKNRLLNVLKWVLIISGVLFLFQIIITVFLINGLINFDRLNFDSIDFDKFNKENFEKIQKIPVSVSVSKEFEPIIDYIEQYKKDNGKYPSDIKEIKKKKDVTYNYETSKDGNCYTLTLKKEKKNETKQYQKCHNESDNGKTNSESYVEYKR